MNMQNKTGFAPSGRENEHAVHVTHGDVIMTFGEKNAFTYTVKDPVGIHARPAAALVKLTKDYKSEITFSANGKSAGANSIIELMSLGVKKGTRLKVEAHGEDEKEALDAFRVFLREHL